MNIERLLEPGKLHRRQQASQGRGSLVHRGPAIGARLPGLGRVDSPKAPGRAIALSCRRRSRSAQINEAGPSRRVCKLFIDHCATAAASPPLVPTVRPPARAASREADYLGGACRRPAADADATMFSRQLHVRKHSLHVRHSPKDFQRFIGGDRLHDFKFAVPQALGDRRPDQHLILDNQTAATSLLRAARGLLFCIDVAPDWSAS
jgi:hypothetical protein